MATRKDAATLTNEAIVMPPLLETLHWDEEQDSNRGEGTATTPLSHIPQSTLRESTHLRVQIDSLIEELASMKLQMQQMQVHTNTTTREGGERTANQHRNGE